MIGCKQIMPCFIARYQNPHNSYGLKIAALKNVKTLEADTIADYFLSLTEPDTGDFISNLKLQKLLYYSQGFHLAVFGQPLFSEDLLAWQHGPVVERIYHKYKDAPPALPLPESLDLGNVHEIQVGLLNSVYSSFGQFSAWKLRNMTHHEPPWEQTAQGAVIPHKLLIDYFKTQIEEPES